MNIDTRPSQIAGAAVLLGWSALLIVGLPRVADAIPRDEAVADGSSVTVAGITVVPSAGWSASKEVSTVLILRKAGAQILAVPPKPAEGDGASIANAGIKIVTADPSATWQVGGPESFTTAGGGAATCITAQAVDQFLMKCGVVFGGQAVDVTVTGTPESFSAVSDELTTIIKTMALAGGAS